MTETNGEFTKVELAELRRMAEESDREREQEVLAEWRVLTAELVQRFGMTPADLLREAKAVVADEIAWNAIQLARVSSVLPDDGRG